MYEIALTTLSLCLMMGLSAYGSASGMALSSTSSALYARNTKIIKYSYFACIFSSTPIIMSLVLALIIINKIDRNLDFENALKITVGNIVNGFSGYYGGNAIGLASKNIFRMLDKNDKTHMCFYIIMIAIEMLMVIGIIIPITIFLGNN